MSSVQVAPLDYYAAHGFALFPCAWGTKRPLIKWKDGSTTDRAAWAAWQADNSNLAVDCAKSGLIVVDIDSSKVSREEAWAAYARLVASWQLPSPPRPMTQSARGGWHVPFRRPADVAPTDLRGGGTLVKISDIRPLQPGEDDGEVIGFKNRGYCVAAGSILSTGNGDLPYLFYPDAPAPHEAPVGLIEAIRRASVAEPNNDVPVGGYDYDDTKSLYVWLAENEALESRDEWISAGMVAKIEFGDGGLDLYSLICHNQTLDDGAMTQWRSFALPEKAPASSQRLGTLMKLAHERGWKGHIRSSAQKIFQKQVALYGTSHVPVQTSMIPPAPTTNRVAELAANVGATLASDTTAAGVPMDGGQAELTRLALPVLEQFLADTSDAPTTPAMVDPPTLPPQMSGHGLYDPLNATILRVLALAEQAKFKADRCTAALAVLRVAHKDVFEAVARRVATIGKSLKDSKIKLASTDLEDRVQRAFVKQDAWITDTKGLPEPDNPDNVVTFLGIIGAEVRWNNWLNRLEIQGFEWSNWTAVDDDAINCLVERAFRTGTRFKVADKFLKSILSAIARRNIFDPVLERINSLVWDGTPRLSQWLSATCAVPLDAYHQAVGRNVIGGMVKRARTPGAKHDEVMILIGKQGTAKSTLCRTLALSDDWFTDSVAFDGSPQNIVPQLFGKLVVELAELDGMAKKEVQHIKAFITRQSDNVTLKYKAFASDFERRCIFVGTSNEDSPLVDITGNRRFLPVRVPGEINIAWLKSNIEQIVAEAAHCHKAGDDFSIPREVWDVAAQHQEAARAITDVEAMLCEWFSPTEFTKAAFISTADLIRLSDIAGWRGVHALRRAIMMRLGFVECRPRLNGLQMRGWLRKPDDLPRHVEHVTHYVVSKDQDGRPRVTIRQAAAVPAVAVCPVPLPPIPGR